MPAWQAPLSADMAHCYQVHPANPKRDRLESPECRWNWWANSPCLSSQNGRHCIPRAWLQLQHFHRLNQITCKARPECPFLLLPSWHSSSQQDLVLDMGRLNLLPCLMWIDGSHSNDFKSVDSTSAMRTYVGLDRQLSIELPSIIGKQNN